MKKIIKKIGATLAIVAVLALSVGLFAPAAPVAADCAINSGLGGALGGDCMGNAAKNAGMQTGSLFGNGSIVSTIINVVLFIVGILCVIMIIYSGIRYVISRGKTEEVKNAKDTLLYAIVGLIVAMVAYALVNWVFTSVGSS